MNRYQITQELHDLIDGLDFNKASTDEKRWAIQGFFPHSNSTVVPSTINQLFSLLEKAQLPKER